MATIAIEKVTRDNWRDTLKLGVRPEQQRFVAEHTPITALGLAKAYVRPGGLTWVPYVIYADSSMVGFIELAYAEQSTTEYWIFHFFIDQAHQGKGYGKQALLVFLELITAAFPQCREVRLTLHPDNAPAQRLYESLGFEKTGEERFGEPVYVRNLSAFPR